MRIAIILPLLISRTGPQRFVAEVTKALRAKGCKVRVFSLIYKKEETFESLREEHIVYIRHNLLSRIFKYLLKIFFHKWNRIEPSFIGVPVSVFVVPILALFAIIKYKPNVLIINSGQTLICILKLIFKRVRIVLLYHGGGFPTIRASTPLLKFLRIFEKTSARICIPVTNSCIVSHFLEKELGIRPYVIHFGVDKMKFDTISSIRRNDSKTLLYVGRIAPYKRQDFLIKLMPSILKRVEDAKLVLIGNMSMSDKEYYKHLTKLINKLGLHEAVKIITNASDAEVLKAYSESSVYVNPSHEPLGTNILEAMAAGLPAIVSKRSENAEVVLHGETGFVLKDSPKEWIDHIVMLLIDSNYRKELSTKARAWGLSFSWDKTATKLLSLVKHSRS